MPPPATPAAHHARPPVERMTDACENITFPQLLLRTVIIKAQGWIQDSLYENVSHLGAAPTLYFAPNPYEINDNLVRGGGEFLYMDPQRQTVRNH